MQEEVRSAGPVRFGVFELDRRSGELRKAGAQIHLQEQAFQILTSLLERPGDLVTREELRHRLWPNGTFVDFEHGLNAVISRLRGTIGDSADSPRFIQTVPRRGYRFIAPVEGAVDAAQAGLASRWMGRATPIAVVGLIVLVVAIVLFRRAAATDSPHFRAVPAHETGRQSELAAARA